MSDLARYKSKQEWETKNPVLSLDEPGFEDDTGKLKVGDGVTQWLSLPYSDSAPYTLPSRLTGANNDSGWVEIDDFLNGWEQGEPSYGSVAVRKIGAIVYMRGCVRNGTYGQDAFFVPDGFMPPHPREMLVLGYDSNWGIVVCNAAVRLNGAVRLSASGGAATQQGIVLSTEYVRD